MPSGISIIFAFNNTTAQLNPGCVLLHILRVNVADREVIALA